MSMRYLLAFPLFSLAVLQAEAADAQAWYWCEPARAYYPYVARCPVPWRLVNPSSIASQPYGSPQSPPMTGQPTPLLPTLPDRFPLLGDSLDDWCKNVQLPSSAAICSDAQLRALALGRQHAYDETKARLDAEQQKALLADQNSWVKSYARACGLAPDAPPLLPLSPEIKNCMLQAGQARLTYLKAYAGQETAPRPDAKLPALPSNEPQQNEQPSSRSDWMFAPLIIASVVIIILIAVILIKRQNKIKHRNQIIEHRNQIISSLGKTIKDTVSLHSRALLRKRFQTLRHDDYGNPIWDPWLKEIKYFIDTVLIPSIYGDEERALFFQQVAPYCAKLVDTMIEKEAGLADRAITFGPNFSPVDYENYCAEQLRISGWNAHTTKASGDQGSDVIAEKGGRVQAIQSPCGE
jgi:uncharacterized protein YecT (DUF1311 family)